MKDLLKISEFIVIILILYGGCKVRGQSQEFVVSGTVYDSISQQPIEKASVILKLDKKFFAYAYTNSEGSFKISIKNFTNNLKLTVNSLGYKKQEVGIGPNTNKISFFLVPAVENLEEVVLRPDEKIEINRDTVSYKVNAFTNETEQTVEDVLKNIPGVEIDGDGNIKAQGKNIKKILIEGDDLAGRDYKIISKNLGAQTLDKVEIISNYEENPVLKQFLNSEATVLNLKLKDKSKTVLFGNLTAGAGNRERAKFKANLGLIREKIKFLNLGSWDNSGEFAENQLSNYTYNNNMGFNDFDKDFSEKIESPVYLSSSSISLEKKKLF